MQKIWEIAINSSIFQDPIPFFPLMVIKAMRLSRDVPIGGVRGVTLSSVYGTSRKLVMQQI